jgi:hypothetical protein
MASRFRVTDVFPTPGVSLVKGAMFYSTAALFVCETTCSNSWTQPRRLLSMEFLWIDAICIDQNNLAERGHQVERMGRIYDCATEVLIWLGIFKSLEHIANYLRRRRSVSKFAYSARKELLHVMKHPYWKRAWVSECLLLILSPPTQVHKSYLRICSSMVPRLVFQHGYRSQGLLHVPC